MSENNLFVIEPDNKLYKKALKRELGIWYNKKTIDFLNESFESVRFAYKGKDYDFNKNIDWINFFAKFGPFDKVLILGGNETQLEEYLIKEGIVNTIINYDIINEKNSSDDINQFADLNFVELPQNQFDLIIAKSILHHIINLEHLVYQTNYSLKENGIFVVFEYAGENKQQWSDKKIKIINDEIDFTRKMPNYCFSKLEHNYYNAWPFESIRSQEIPGILNQIYKNKIFEIQWEIFSFPLRYHLGQYCIMNKIVLDQKDQIDFINKARMLNKKYQDDNSLLRNAIFGIYQKSQSKIPEIEKWDKYKINKELKLRGPLKYRINSIIRTHQNNYFIRIGKVIKKIIWSSQSQAVPAQAKQQ